MSLGQAEFEYVRRLVHERSAIVIESSKGYLVESRLSSLARRVGCDSIDALVALLRTGGLDGLHCEVVEAMITNETSFFRDRTPFEALRTTMLPGLIERRAAERRLNLWSAGCSTGQEPYSIAMVIRDHLPGLASWRVRIVATDLSETGLARAREGRFGQIEVKRGLPTSLLLRHFTLEGLRWAISDELRRMVEFRQMNLATPWPPMPPMDVVFLRNVLIYFSPETKKRILAELRSVLRPDGWLVLGGVESTIGIDDAYERVQCEQASLYRLRSA